MKTLPQRYTAWSCQHKYNHICHRISVTDPHDHVHDYYHINWDIQLTLIWCNTFKLVLLSYGLEGLFHSFSAAAEDCNKPAEMQAILSQGFVVLTPCTTVRANIVGALSRKKVPEPPQARAPQHLNHQKCKDRRWQHTVQMQNIVTPRQPQARYKYNLHTPFQSG